MPLARRSSEKTLCSESSSGRASMTASSVCSTNLAAISCGDRTWSMQPVAVAASGMPGCCAVVSCAKVAAPAARKARTPCAPSAPVPESTTPAAPRPRSCASDSKNASMRRCSPGARGTSLSRPPDIRSSASGGMTCTWPASTTVPSVACTTLSLHCRASSSARLLEWLGSKCWSTTRPTGALPGSALNSALMASRPPAEAPTPTTTGAASFLRSGWL